MERKHGKEKDNYYFSAGFELGYLYRSIKEKLNNIAATSGGKISGHGLARRLAEILSAEESGTILGIASDVQPLRRTSTKGSKILESLEMGSSSRNRKTSVRVLSDKGRKNISKAQKARWAKVHKENKPSGIKLYWQNMTPAQRSAEMKRRMKVKTEKAA